MTKKSKLFSIIGAGAIALGVVLGGIMIQPTTAAASVADVFDYASATQTVRYKTYQSDPADASARKGLLLYAYDSGASVPFKANCEGVFTAELTAVGSETSSVDLKSYSLQFEDAESGQTFSVVIANKPSQKDVSVRYGGEQAGIHYYEGASTQAFGLTGEYNAAGIYTSFSSDSAMIIFDPIRMEVLLKCDDGVDRTVWNFSNTYNDGKKLENNLLPFGEYTVSVVFDEINENSRGNILLYSFDGYELGVATADFKPTVKAEIVNKAVLGQSYVLPEARVTDVFEGEISNAFVKTEIYDYTGNLVSESNSFTPTVLEPYYIYYIYEKNGEASTAYYKVDTVEQEHISTDYIFEQTLPKEITVGQSTELYIPKASVESTLFISTMGENAQVSLYKDGVAIEEKQKVLGGFSYAFDEIGEYQIVYSSKKLTGEWAQTESFKVIVDANILGVLLSDTLEEIYAFNSLLTIPTATMHFGGESLATTSSVIYPSGKEVMGTTVLLDELGLYRLLYTSEDGNYTQEESFSVKNVYSEFFQSSYAGDDAFYSEVLANNQTSGVKLTLRENSTVKYDRIIDLSDNTFNTALSDRSKNTTLLEMYAQPQRINSPDVDALYITLTDAHNPDNYLEIRMKYLSYSNQGVYIRTRAAGQANWIGYNYNFWTTALDVHDASVHEEGGFYSYFSVSHEFHRQFENLALRLYFDNATGCLYGEPAWKTGYTESGPNPDVITPWLIRDYKTTDETLSSGNKPWAGFTTGEVYMTVYAKGISSTADFYITELDGKKLDSKFVEPSAPKISVNMQENVGVPYALINTKYPLFDYAVENAGSAIIEEKAEVYRMSGEIIDRNRKVRVTDGGFTPTTVGKYAIVYTAKNAYGLTCEEVVVVEAKNSIDAPILHLDFNSIPQTAFYGEKIVLPKATAIGGAGWAKVAYSVKNNGEDVEIAHGAFYCLGLGDFEISVTATDYIGSQTVSVYTVEGVVYKDTPIFDEGNLILPPAFIVGDTYMFGEYIAKLYGDGNMGAEVPARIEITDGNGTKVLDESRAYTPAKGSATDGAIVKICFEKNGANALEIVKSIPVREIKNGTNFISHFFVEENAIKTADINNVLFTVAEGQTTMEFSFIRPVDSRNLCYKLSLPEGKRNFESVRVILQDMYDASSAVEICFRKVSGGLVCLVNGGKEVPVNMEGGTLRIGYSEATRTLTDILGVEIAKIERSANGEPFNGFASGAVYIKTIAEGIYGDCCIGVQTINNQTINLLGFDIQKPNITLLDAFEGRYAKNQTVSIPMAVAYDVLNAIGGVTVEVSKEGGGVYVEKQTIKDSMTFIPTELGYYVVTYTVRDAANNTETVKKYFSVYDAEKPTISFKSEIPKTAKAGSTLKLPAYVLADNCSLNDLTVRVYVFTPDGMSKELKDRITFKMVGYYSINYIVIDKNNNINTYTFGVLVK